MAKAPEKIGRYTIEEEIGKGGMAKVYRAYDPNVKRQVALKLMSAHLTEDEEFRARFRREAEAVAALEHVGIVPIYDFGEDDEQLFIVMRLMNGGTLKEQIQKGPISVEEAGKIFRRIALALDKAHDNGIIHRDLKPGNILFDQDGAGYIADFGVAHLAKSGEALTGTGALIGTPAYMSPEQVQGAKDEIDGRSDIYSLGVILFEMLSGNTPYNSDTPMGTALMHILEPVPRVLDLNPNLPASIEEIINTAMAKEKEDRFSKAKDMADAIDEVIAGSYMPTQKIEDRDKVRETINLKKSGGRKGLLWGLIGLAAIVAIGYFLFQSDIFGGTDADDQVSGGPIAIGVESSPTPAPPATPTEVAPTFTPGPTEVPALNLAAMTSGNIGQLTEISILGRGTINDVVLSPDGAVIAVAGGIGVWLYDSETLTLQAHFESSDGLVLTSLAWSPDTENLRIVTGGVDGSLRIWNPSTGQQLLNIDAHQESINAVAWSPDGNLIASGSADNTIKFWNPATGGLRFTLEGHPNDITQLSWSPDGEKFASSGWTVILWDIELKLNVVSLGGHKDQIESITWSPDSAQLISASSDTTMRVWNTESAKLITSVEGQDTPVHAVAWAPDGERVVQSKGKDILVRNASMEIQSVLEGHSANVDQFIWLEDGSRLLSLASNGEMILWDAQSWELLLRNTEHTGKMNSAAISPDGSKVASGSVDGIVRIWETATGIQLEMFVAHEKAINSIDWSPDGSTLATASDDGTGRLWDVETLVEIRQLFGHTGPVNIIAWSPDGSMVGTTSADLTIRIWNADEGIEIYQYGQKDPIRSFAWSPDGVRVALSSGNKLLIRNALDGQTIYILEQDATVNGVAWAPNGEWLATTSVDKTVNVWNAEGGALKTNKFFGHSEASVSVAWSTDNNMIFTASTDGEIIVWDLATGAKLIVLAGHTDQIRQIVLLDDLILVSVGLDGTVRIWAIRVN